MNNIITYAIDKETGDVFSRVDSEMAVPVLQYDKIGEGGNFNGPLEYKLEKCSIFALSYYWQSLRWTKKIPAEIKNQHRAFWGFKPLK